MRRIYGQNLIAIVPVFLAVALIWGFLTHRNIESELLWGNREKTVNLAVGFAESVDSEVFSDDGLNKEKLLPVFRQLDRWRIIKSLYFYSAAGERLEYHYRPLNATEEKEKTEYTAGPPSQNAVQTLMAEGSFYRQPFQISDGSAYSMAGRAVKDRLGNVAGYIAVYTGADRYFAEYEDLVFKVALLVIVSLGIGILISLIISALVVSRINDLSRAAHRAANGDYNVVLRPGLVQELSDLGNTFNTMSSVLKDVLYKARRALVEGEQFRSARELARRYQSDKKTDLKLSGAQYKFYGHRPEHYTDFLETVETEHVKGLLAGRVGANDPLKNAVKSSVVPSFFRACLKTSDTEKAFSDTGERFQAEELIFIAEENGSLSSYRLESGRVEKEQPALSPGEFFIAGTAGRKKVKSSFDYISSLYSDAGPDEIIDRVREEQSGSLFLICYLSE